MVWYNVALLVHILGVLGVFIATGIEQVVLLRLRSARTTQLVREWVRVMAGVDKLFPPSVLLLLLAGLYMTFTVWGWDDRLASRAAFWARKRGFRTGDRAALSGGATLVCE